MPRDSKAKFDRLIERFSSWADTQPDIRAALIIGSRARVDHPADEWADLDMVLITTDPERYLSETDWLKSIGSTLLTFLERTAEGKGFERRVLFEGGLDVDFAVFSVEDTQRYEKRFAAVLREGARVLIDRDNIVARFSSSVIAEVLSSTLQPTDAISFDCGTLFLTGKLPAFPCFAFSRLMDEGSTGICEST